ncbi:hypothetical protein MSPP1_003859 [Malassezia sp. CBS 17886]|nr:hypothetical protein MSPP1_003859 [Malassezia sp. CBS 17886]
MEKRAVPKSKGKIRFAAGGQGAGDAPVQQRDAVGETHGALRSGARRQRGADAVESAEKEEAGEGESGGEDEGVDGGGGEDGDEDGDEDEDEDDAALSDASRDTDSISAPSDASRDTDDEINQRDTKRSKKTQKRKRRAVSPTAFGETLEALLRPQEAAAPTPASILSLAPSIRRTANATTLRAKAARLALDHRRQREERAHVKDVIGSWGPPGMLPGTDAQAPTAWMDGGGAKGYERKLRKVAQRGVVKLFNAIRAAQTTSAEDVDKARAQPKSQRTNALGSRDVAVNELSKTNFLELLRSGAPEEARPRS